MQKYKEQLTMVFILLLTFLITLIIQSVLALESTIEFAMILIVTSLIINIIYVTFSVIKAKRKFNKELRLDAKKRDLDFLYKDLV